MISHLKKRENFSVIKVRPQHGELIPISTDRLALMDSATIELSKLERTALHLITWHSVDLRSMVELSPEDGLD